MERPSKLFYQTAYVKHIMAEYLKGIMPDMSGYGVRRVSHFNPSRSLDFISY